MFCNGCGARIIDNNSQYCHKCGIPLTNSLKLKAIKCPNCNATMPLSNNTEKITCDFCKTDFSLDNAATEMTQILRAKSDARKRDLQMQAEYENHKLMLAFEEKKLQFFITNWWKIVVMILCVLYVVYKCINDKIVGFDFVMMIIVFKVLMIPRNKTKK